MEWIWFAFKFDCSVSDEDENLYIIERKQNRNRLNDFRNQLYALLAKPIFPMGFSFKWVFVQRKYFSIANWLSKFKWNACIV